MNVVRAELIVNKQVKSSFQASLSISETSEWCNLYVGFQPGSKRHG